MERDNFLTPPINYIEMMELRPVVLNSEKANTFLVMYQVTARGPGENIFKTCQCIANIVIIYVIARYFH